MGGKELIQHIADLNEQETLSAVQRRLTNGDDPLDILRDCQEGMRQVGKLYEKEEYFISGLIMAGEIFRQTMELIHPVVRVRMSGDGTGRILLGTVQGDIHDLGKDMAKELLACHGFEVHDLGVDVSPDAFIEGANRFRPDIIGISILMTNALDYLKETVSKIRNSPIVHVAGTPIIIGGSLADKDVSDHVKADYWVNDAMDGVRTCLKLMSGKE